jgi:hypothetical protein
MGVAPNVSTWYWSNTGNDFWSDLTEWVNQLASSENLPYVHAGKFNYYDNVASW